MVINTKFEADELIAVDKANAFGNKITAASAEAYACLEAGAVGDTSDKSVRAPQAQRLEPTLEAH